jgi:hypothetical protein
MYGSSKVDRDVPKLPDVYKRGELKFDELSSRGIKLEEVNDALTAMESGEVAQAVIVFCLLSNLGATMDRQKRSVVSVSRTDRACCFGLAREARHGPLG